MFTESDVTLYIPYFNTEVTIGPCIDAALKQTARPARILVVDDGSRIPFDDDRVEVIRHPVNSGLAAARNTALDACRTPLIASLDSDVVPDPDWLQHLLDEINLDHVVGAGGCLLEKYQDNLGNLWRAEHMKQHWGESAVRNPRFLYGANTLYRVDALHEVGRYDVRLRTNNEDRTISEALYANCHDLIYTPSALCYHLRRDTYRSILHGYWQWHHARGLLRGDFNSPEGIIRRISEVNFGIFRYRFNLDTANGRFDLLGLDACVPWVFCAKDLILYHRTTGQPVPDFPGKLLGCVSSNVSSLLGPMLPELSNSSESVDSRLSDDYINEFIRCLETYKWFQDSQPTEELIHRVDHVLESIPV